MARHLTRDRAAVLAGLCAPLALAAILVPFRSSFPNTDAALAMLLAVVAVAANGDRLADAGDTVLEAARPQRKQLGEPPGHLLDEDRR